MPTTTRAPMFALALAAVLLAPTMVRADDAGADGGADGGGPLVAYDPQRSMGYGGCDAAPGAPSMAMAGATLGALATAATRRRRRDGAR